MELSRVAFRTHFYMLEATVTSKIPMQACKPSRKYEKLLSRVKGPLYKRLMCLSMEKPAAHAFDIALGRKRFAWMEQGQ